MRSDELDVKRWLRDQVEVPPMGVVVDLGCGRGDDIRALASAHPSLECIGIDRHPPEGDGATAFGLENLRFVRADLSRGVPLQSASADGVVSTNVLECLADQGAFVEECARVLRPMGQIVVAHYDWDTQTFGGEDRDLVRRIIHAFSDWKQAWMDAIDPWAGRRLRGLFARSGAFTGEIRARTLISTSFEPDSYGRRQAESFGGLVRRGLIGQQEYDAFMGFQREAAASGAFMFSVTMYAFVGRKR